MPTAAKRQLLQPPAAQQCWRRGNTSCHQDRMTTIIFYKHKYIATCYFVLSLFLVLEHTMTLIELYSNLTTIHVNGSHIYKNYCLATI